MMTMTCRLGRDLRGKSACEDKATGSLPVPGRVRRARCPTRRRTEHEPAPDSLLSEVDSFYIDS